MSHKYASQRVLDAIAHNVNARWGRKEAKPDRRQFQNGTCRAVHLGYIHFWTRRGIKPPPVSTDWLDVCVTDSRRINS